MKKSRAVFHWKKTAEIKVNASNVLLDNQKKISNIKHKKIR